MRRTGSAAAGLCAMRELGTCLCIFDIFVWWKNSSPPPLPPLILHGKYAWRGIYNLTSKTGGLLPSSPVVTQVGWRDDWRTGGLWRLQGHAHPLAHAGMYVCLVFSLTTPACLALPATPLCSLPPTTCYCTCAFLPPALPHACHCACL